MESYKATPSNNISKLPTGSVKKTIASQIISDVLSGDALLFHDQYKETYIAPMGDGRKVIRLSSKEFRAWLAYYYWKKEGKVLPRDADKQVIQTLEAAALFDGLSHELSVRLSRTEKGLWYDLVNGTAVMITPKKWQVVDTFPIMFKQVQQKAQVPPVQDGDLELLRAYINVDSDEDWLLFLTYVISAFIPGFPHPLLILHGPQGAGKTTPMRVIKELVDPSIVQGMPLPDKIPEFVQLADHHAFLFFDNLSTMPIKMSDALARASTGDSFSKRQLFTDSDDVVYKIQKTIALNGINQVITKPDLLDRAILIKLKRISQEERIPEADFWSAFEADKPRILGAIFDTLVKTLAIYPTVHLESAPRMADFSRWGCAIAESISYGKDSFLEAYKDNISKQNEEAIEASPVAKAVIAFVGDYKFWEGTAEELLKDLNKRYGMTSLTSSPLWPKAPEWMTRRLNDAETNLNAVGIRIDYVRSSNGRTIILTCDSDNELPSEPDVEDDISSSEQQSFIDSSMSALSADL